MRALLLVFVCALAQVPAGGAAVVPNDDKAITHALNRLAFGPAPGDVERVRRIGLGNWIDDQLQPSRVKQPDLENRLARLTTLELDSRTLAQDYFAPAREERRRRQQANQGAAGAPPDGPPDLNMPMSETLRRGRQPLAELMEAKVLRAVYSDRQLEEVLVDFWFNHFNVFARKGQTELYINEYEREAIRPHVFGTFRELLGATARSPAMLFYLDNWLSADPDMTARLKPGPGNGAARAAATQPGRSRGLNENYARELLELHTLGVDGGYTQQDVVDVARALTGWTIARPGLGRGGLRARDEEPGFRFAPMMHDRGEKRVLGQVIRAGGGIEDGERVLDIVASHPSTAKHIAFKLAQRFVSDTPPQTLVDRAAERFRATKGDLREVVRAIITSPEFFATAAYGAKVKTPFEFIVSALRATNADVRSALPLARSLQMMGMPLYLCQPPTGYDETADTWVSSGALVNRMNFAVELSSNRLRGISVPSSGKNDIALTIGAPEFQRQ